LRPATAAAKSGYGNPANGALLRAIAAHDAPVWSLAFSSDGGRLVTTSDHEVRLWTVGTGALLDTLKPEGGTITRAALSPDGTTLAVTSTDGRVRLWNLDKASIVRDIAADVDVVWSVAFSPDGRELATASSDEVVGVWDVATGEQRASLTGHTGGATDLSFLADGTTLAVVDRSGKLHLWVIRSDWVDAWPEAWQGSCRTKLAQSARHSRMGLRFATTGANGRFRHLFWDPAEHGAEPAEIGGAALRRRSAATNNRAAKDEAGSCLHRKVP
jgi:WD40 repeat protein